MGRNSAARPHRRDQQALLSQQDYKNEAERKLYMEQISKNSENLMKLINDIIDISKIQENQIDIKKVKFDLNLLIGQIYEQFLFTSPQIKSNKLVV
jgi:signal transduction histidine kinase